MIFRFTLPGDKTPREFDGEHESEAWMERNRLCWARNLDPKDYPITTDAGLTNIQLEIVRAKIAEGETDVEALAEHARQGDPFAAALRIEPTIDELGALVDREIKSAKAARPLVDAAPIAEGKIR